MSGHGTRTGPVTGMVHGIGVWGELPEVFARYLWPSGARTGLSGRILQVHYKPVSNARSAREVWSGSLPDGASGSRISLFEHDGGVGLRVQGRHQGDFRINQDAIEVEWLTGENGAAHYFYSCAMPIWLELQELPVLHAGAVSVNGNVVLFAGASGAGKSTLCSAMTGLGWKFVSDDGVAVHDQGVGSWSCFPGPPLVSLWPSSPECRDRGRGVKWPHPLSDKRILALRTESYEVRRSAEKLAAVYVIKRRPAGTELLLEPYGPGESLIKLVEHSMAWAPMTSFGVERRRLDQFARMIKQMSVKRLEFPCGSDQWKRIKAAIKQDLKEIFRAG